MIVIFPAISCMAVTVLVTASPDSLASMAALLAMTSVCRALSAFCWMPALISSMEDEDSSTAAACSVAPWEMASAEAESCSLPAATLSAPDCTSRTIADRVSIISPREASMASASERLLTLTRRSPWASCRVMAATWASAVIRAAIAGMRTSCSERFLTSKSRSPRDRRWAAEAISFSATTSLPMAMSNASCSERGTICTSRLPSAMRCATSATCFRASSILPRDSSMMSFSERLATTTRRSPSAMVCAMIATRFSAWARCAKASRSASLSERGG